MHNFTADEIMHSDWKNAFFKAFLYWKSGLFFHGGGK